MMIWIISSIAVVVVGGLVAAWIVSRKRITRNLQSIATQLGLEFSPAPSWFMQPRVAGPRRGRAVQIFNYSTGSGKTRRVWSAISAHPAGDGRLTFALRKRYLTTRINQIFGPRPITTGDEEFDKAWFVQTNQPEFLRAALIPELRVQLMEARRAGAKGKLELEHAVVKYSESGYFTSAKCVGRFLALADVVCDLADVAEVAAKT